MSIPKSLDFVVSLDDSASSPLSLACVRGWGDWNQLVRVTLRSWFVAMC